MNKKLEEIRKNLQKLTKKVTWEDRKKAMTGREENNGKNNGKRRIRKERQRSNKCEIEMILKTYEKPGRRKRKIAEQGSQMGGKINGFGDSSH